MSLHTRDDWDAAVEVFNGEMIHSFQTGDKYGTDTMMFKSATGHETSNYPIMGTFEAENSPDGIDVDLDVDANTNDVTTPKMEVDDPLKKHKLIPLDQIQVRPELRLPTEYAGAIGRSLPRGKAIRCTGLLANAADDSGNGVQNIVTVDNESASYGTLVANAYKYIGAAMDDAGVPEEGRFSMLQSNAWYNLFDVPGVQSKDYGQPNNTTQKPGRAIDWMNFTIINGASCKFGTDTTATPWAGRMPAKYEYDMTNLIAVVWQREAWALQHWVAPMMLGPDWISMRDSYKVEARMIMGAMILQVEGVWIITKDANTA